MSIKISELPVASTIGNNDIIPIVQESTTKSIKYEKFKPTIETTIDSSSTDDNPVSPKAVYDYSAPIDHASESTTYGQGTETKYGHCKTINNVTSASYVAGESLSAYQGAVLKGEIDTTNTNLQELTDETLPSLLEGKENKSNKTNVLDSNSTETQYPNAQVTFEKYSELLDQIPTATATGNPINVQDSSNLPIKGFALLGNATQADTPTPDTPQDIHVVTGDNTVKVVGKNLYDGQYEENRAINSSGATYSSNGRNTTPFIKVEPDQTYTMSGVAVYRVAWYDEKKIFIAGQAPSQQPTTYSFTLPNNAKYVRLSGENATWSKLQLEVGSTATTYEPYTEQTTTLSLGNIELAKIGNYTDRIFKSSDKWYVYKALKKVVLDGTNIAFSGKSSSTANTIWMAPADNELKNYNSTLPYTLPISNYFIGNNTLFTTDIEGIFVENKRVKCGFTNETDLTTLELANEWLTTHNVIAYCQLETPTTTEITDTTLLAQLENILKMHTNKNVTNISIVPTGTNAEPTAEVEYRQDLQTVIGNLQTAILSL